VAPPIKWPSTRLNLRVAILLHTPQGYIFERDGRGVYFPIGGRIKTNETSINAAIRETKEEIGINLNELQMAAIIENFFNYNGEPFHELRFVYKAGLDHNIGLPSDFYAIDSPANLDIRPKIIWDIIEAKGNHLQHFIVEK
jgi:8-oxo-dGTP pyrophosphatase MutT (NUDIX family)